MLLRRATSSLKWEIKLQHRKRICAAWPICPDPAHRQFIPPVDRALTTHPMTEMLSSAALGSASLTLLL